MYFENDWEHSGDHVDEDYLGFFLIWNSQVLIYIRYQLVSFISL